MPNSATAFAPLNHQPAYKLLADEVSRMILRGTLKLGDPMPTEALLCEQFKVTRSTVREGIRLLEETGLVRRTNSKRLVVSRPSSVELSRHTERAMVLHEVTFMELWETAMILEPQAARLATAKLVDADIAALQDNLRRTELAVAAGGSLVALDIEFHSLVACAAHNKVLVLAREPMARLFYPSFEAVFATVPNAATRLLKAHRSIVAALAARDEEEVVKWMSRHIEDFKRGFQLAGRDILAPANKWMDDIA